MGKIIKDGFAFMEHANSGLIRKIDDIPELKHKLILLSESKTHIEMSKYALNLAGHILYLSGMERSGILEECFTVNIRWQNKEKRFREALDVAGKINDLAREEKDMVKCKALRAMGQVAATPHVRWHPLVASEYAVVMINLLCPKNFDKVREERELQIEMMEKI